MFDSHELRYVNTWT